MAAYGYAGEHSITIGENLLSGGSKRKNTWFDWRLIPASRPVVNPPAPNINMISIPGADGALDITDVLSGRVTYGNRSGNWSFYVENGYENWYNRYSEIMKYLHGQSFQVILEDEPIYYYEGRLSVNEWRSDASHSIITISYNLEPYKKYSDSGDNYLWDPLYFGDPSIQSDKGDFLKRYSFTLLPREAKPINIENGYGESDMLVSVVGSGTRPVSMSINGKSYSLPHGLTNLPVNLDVGSYSVLITNTDQDKAVVVKLYLTGGLL